MLCGGILPFELGVVYLVQEEWAVSENDSEQAQGTALGAWTAQDGLRYEALENPPDDLIRSVNHGLYRYNTTRICESSYARLGVFAYADADAGESASAEDGSSQRTVIGGLVGDLVWDWLHIDALWVDEAYRGRGVGGALMQRAEEMARARGIVNTHLETTSFQALPFYQKLGYEVFAELPDKPKGSTWYYLKKQGEPA
jgi:ribosomal protein S18 acetylase RimI-like enzyme